MPGIPASPHAPQNAEWPNVGIEVYGPLAAHRYGWIDGMSEYCAYLTGKQVYPIRSMLAILNAIQMRMSLAKMTIDVDPGAQLEVVW